MSKLDAIERHTKDVARRLVREDLEQQVEALEQRQQKLVEALKLRTGCERCKGRGQYERHKTGYTHYETDAGEECPAYHFERIQCRCSEPAAEALREIGKEKAG